MELIQTCLLWLFAGATLVQLVFWGLVFSRLAFYRTPKRRPETTESVSVVICAHNEADNLKKNLDHFLNQIHRSFEILVVNDGSTDHTPNILLEYTMKYDNLRVLHVEKTPESRGKKTALTAGIRAARHDIVLLSDADCRPAGPHWITGMQASLQNGVEIGLGYGPYEAAPGLLNRFIRFETVYTAVQYCSFALARMPYMGVGRNLIYRRELFEKAGGFTSHRQVASGDDDLFVNAVAKENNTTIVLDPQTFVFSQPEKSWRAYYRQKRRHLSTARYYQTRHQLLLGMLSLSHFFHYMGGAVLILLKFSTMFVALIFALRIMLIWYLYGRILKKLREPSLLGWIPLLDAVYVTYYLIFTTALLTTKQSKWN